jgi:hypothetical protein
LLRLSNLGVYWAQKEILFLHSLPKEQVLERMRELIIAGSEQSTHKFYSQYMLLVNLEAKLFQGHKGDLENLQLQQMIRLAEVFAVYSSKLN